MTHHDALKIIDLLHQITMGVGFIIGLLIAIGAILTWRGPWPNR